MWILTEDKIFGGKVAGTIGPGDTPFKPHEIIERGKDFRLLDGDRNVYFEGKCILDDKNTTGFEPLDDYGRSCGCKEIQYKDGEGKWQTL